MPDYQVTLHVQDVSDGDIQVLAELIMNEHGDDFDAPRGDFTITASKREGTGWFPLDLDAA